MTYEVVSISSSGSKTLAEGFNTPEDAQQWFKDNYQEEMGNLETIHIVQSGVMPTIPFGTLPSLHELADLLGDDGQVYVGDPNTGNWDLIQGNDPGDENDHPLDIIEHD